MKYKKIRLMEQLVDKYAIHLFESRRSRKTLKEDDSKVRIKVDHPGVLEVPEGKHVSDLGEDHFKKLVRSKGYEEIARALNNLVVWNKNDDPKLSKWADHMRERLKDWVDGERESDEDFAR